MFAVMATWCFHWCNQVKWLVKFKQFSQFWNKMSKYLSPEVLQLSYNIICDFLLHQMSLVFHEKALEEINPPCVAQSFINHDGVLHKIFAIGDKHFLAERPSVKNLSKGGNISRIKVLLYRRSRGTIVLWFFCLMIMLMALGSHQTHKIVTNYIVLFNIKTLHLYCT